MNTEKLTFYQNCMRTISSEEDLLLLESREAARLLFHMCVIRNFENTLLQLQGEGVFEGPLHTSIGQEAVAVGAMMALEARDRVNGSHRAHHHFIAKTLNQQLAADWDPRTDPTPLAAKPILINMFAEILGLAAGCCGGRGGSMHLIAPEAGFYGSNGIVGGGIPAAVGMAFAQQKKRSGSVVVSFFGDGAINQGAFHEAANLAGLWNLPIIFFVENNLYAVGTHIEKASAVSELAVRGISYGMNCRIVDGMDVVGVYQTVREAVSDLRTGGKPYLVEAKCYRHMHHDSAIAGSAYGYRTRAEEQSWKERDAVSNFPKLLSRYQLLVEKEIEDIVNGAREIVSTALEELVGSARPRRIPAAAWPDARTKEDGLRSTGEEFSAVSFLEPKHREHRLMKYVDVIADVTRRWLRKDERVFIIGEDVANFRQGPYGATRGLMDEFPDRVINTPISEAGFVGLAYGSCLDGLLPIVEIMFPDFVLVAADQFFNQIAKARHMYGNRIDIPLVVRTRVAIGTGMGPQHSLDPVGLFSLFSGWRIVAPSRAIDYIGLFNSSMVSRDPVLILEHHSLYHRTYEVPPPAEWDYCIPFGKARVARRGEDLTVLIYGGMTQRLLDMEEELQAAGVDAEIVDLRSLDPLSLDLQTIVASMERTGRLAIVEETASSQGLSGHLLRCLQDQCHRLLKRPPKLISSPDIPVASSKVLEQATIVSNEAIVAGLAECGGKGK